MEAPPTILAGFTAGRIHLIVRHGRQLKLADRNPIHFAPMFAYFSEDKFAAAGPAATAVLRHRATDLEIKDGAWSFDRGTASRDGRSSAWGKFSHVSEEGWHRDMLSIVASENGEGGWTVTHTIVRAKNA